MAEGNKTPILNPILSLLMEPTPNSVSGGGKSAKGIVTSRLNIQQKKISDELREIQQNDSLVSLAGRFHLIVKMFPDSYAPSWTPDNLFESNHCFRIVAPAYNGFLVEIAKDKIYELINKVEQPKSATVKVDISRLESVSAFSRQEALRYKGIDEIFEKGKDSGFQFNLWLLPFIDNDARLSLCNELENLAADNIINFGDARFDDIFKHGDASRSSLNKIHHKIKKYLVDGSLSFTATIDSKEKLEKLVSSGVVYRIEPVSPICVKSIPPGQGVEPIRRLTNLASMPTVVIIDGGCSAGSYLPLNVMNIRPLVEDSSADLKHGNQVTSVICQGAAWNNNLALPDLECKFVSVQAINKKNIPIQPTTEQFVNYLRDVAAKTKEVSSVWNLSFNEPSPSFGSNEISYLGHEINKIAREFDILPVISIGNVNDKNDSRLCAPADCEAALTISGRTANAHGLPDSPCPCSLKGPAAGGMKKPELSWFSTLRMIGGTIATGTSFSTPLISSVAAHTFNNLKNATPDLVKALLINKSESYSHDLRLGWGSPWLTGKNLPWLCEDGTVTLAWNSKIKVGFAYYWNNIPLPPEMLEDGEIKGEIVLTAILQPLVSELAGDNYFSTRLQCALQSVGDDGKVKNILGSMKESKEKEVESRKELAKWSPIRHHGKVFSGVSVDNNVLRLHARIYARDLYQFGMNSHHEMDEQRVSFVLTFKSKNKGAMVYDSMVTALGTDAEVGVIERNIDINNA
ncbi:S8 family peptidase [Hafnia paralvei]|uniref:S8 family peptidase n=1 Tax=Hafnia paralvei TaxID=546367 RepID=UPI0010338C60|nr:S8 family peptidase [Hafnia paralvei]TBL59563.1 S8 family peptidase [Hafnia paralvei]